MSVTKGGGGRWPHRPLCLISWSENSFSCMDVPGSAVLTLRRASCGPDTRTWPHLGGAGRTGPEPPGHMGGEDLACGAPAGRGAGEGSWSAVVRAARQGWQSCRRGAVTGGPRLPATAFGPGRKFTGVFGRGEAHGPLPHLMTSLGFGVLRSPHVTLCRPLSRRRHWPELSGGWNLETSGQTSGSEQRPK